MLLRLRSSLGFDSPFLPFCLSPFEELGAAGVPGRSGGAVHESVRTSL